MMCTDFLVGCGHVWSACCSVHIDAKKLSEVGQTRDQHMLLRESKGALMYWIHFCAPKRATLPSEGGGLLCPRYCTSLAKIHKTQSVEIVLSVQCAYSVYTQILCDGNRNTRLYTGVHENPSTGVWGGGVHPQRANERQDLEASDRVAHAHGERRPPPLPRLYKLDNKHQYHFVMCDILQSCECQAIQGGGLVFCCILTIYCMCLSTLAYLDYWHYVVCHYATIPCQENVVRRSQPFFLMKESFLRSNLSKGSKQH